MGKNSILEFDNKESVSDVAQLDRAVDFESKGRRFESSQARHHTLIL